MSLTRMRCRRSNWCHPSKSSSRLAQKTIHCTVGRVRARVSRDALRAGGDMDMEQGWEAAVARGESARNKLLAELLPASSLDVEGLDGHLARC